jgi:hypothetical protein
LRRLDCAAPLERDARLEREPVLLGLELPDFFPDFAARDPELARAIWFPPRRVPLKVLTAAIPGASSSNAFRVRPVRKR